MNPLEQIKIGIMKNDMDMVQSGYEAMAKKKPSATPKELETIPDHSEEMVEEDPFKVQIRGENKQQTRELEDGTIEKEARKEAVNLSKIGLFNMFEDDGETNAEYKDEDKDFDKKASSKTKVSRRKEVKKVVATCSHCQKTFKVLPIHQSEGSFICTKCIGGKRRR